MYAITAIAAIMVFAIGVGVLWANPRRPTNQAFSLTALVVTSFLLFLSRAVSAKSLQEIGHPADAVPMLRAASAVILFVPWSLWILKETLVQQGGRVQKMLWRSMPICLVCCGGAWLCFTDAYIPSSALPHEIKRGPGQLINLIGIVVLCVYVARQTWTQMHQQKGIRRVEMQFLVWNAAVAVIFAGGLSFYAYYGELPILRRFIPLVVLLNYAFAAWAFAYYRIFDVKQISLALIGRGGLVLVLGCVTYLATRHGMGFESVAASTICSFVICASLAIVLDRKIGHFLGVSPERALANLRTRVIATAKKNPNPEDIVINFEKLLIEETGCRCVTLLSEEKGVYAAGLIRFDANRVGCIALAESGWVTPESATRKRLSPSIEDLRDFLAEHSLGLLVASPRGSMTPTLLIALGVKANEWPFTYPEIERLQNIAELMDNILTRSRLTMQAALRAKVEHLAMMSGGLAHDLKNLITPVSSFLVHTEGHFASGTIAHEVHAAATDSVRTMADYVREALFFSSKLTPRLEAVDLARLFHDVRAVTAARAEANGVAVTGEPSFPGPVMVDRVLLQRVLVNLVHNAVDASRAGDAVTLSATSARSGWFRLEVSDRGCGIPPEIAGRIFDPYFTTKQVGEELRGFGLGLTISQKIVQLHNGNITLRSPPAGGTVISVDLPIASSN